jgi:hypothetical protein
MANGMITTTRADGTHPIYVDLLPSGGLGIPGNPHFPGGFTYGGPVGAGFTPKEARGAVPGASWWYQEFTVGGFRFRRVMVFLQGYGVVGWIEGIDGNAGTTSNGAGNVLGKWHR